MVLPFGIFATMGVSADEATDVIYVKAGGKGDGSSADSPVGTLDAANKLAAKKTNDVTIKFIGNFTLDASAFADNKYSEPAHKNKITWSKYDDDAMLTIKTTDKARYYSIGGPLAIKDLAIEIDGAKVLVILTNLYDFTVDTGVTCVNPQSEIDTLTVCAGLQTHYENEFYDAATKTHTANPTITIKSGSFKQISGYLHNTSTKLPDVKLNGKVSIYISGEDTYVYQVYAVCNGYNTVTDCDITLDGGIIGRFVGSSDRKYKAGMVKYGPAGTTGTFTLYLTKNFDLSKQDALIGSSADGEFMYAICGTTANKDYEGSVEDEKLGKFILKVDDEIINDVLLEQVMINHDSFDEKQKTDGTVIDNDTPIIHKPSNQPTAKPDNKEENKTDDTTAPVTTPTENANNGAVTNADTAADTTANTGNAAGDEGGVSIGLIIGIGAAVVVVGAVVAVILLKKKKD